MVATRALIVTSGSRQPGDRRTAGSCQGRRIVDRIVGAAVELESGRAYAYRTDNLAALLATGDDVRLNRDYIQKVTPEGPVLVYVQPATSMRGPAQRRQLLGSSELEQAFAQCRADWPADFVMQRYCMERQEEAFLAIQRRR